MAEYLITGIMRIGAAALLGMVICQAPAVRAEVLPDPTRPPDAVLAPDKAEQSAAPQGPVLQSVLIGPARKVAVISGQTVMLGQMYADARVVRITETEVVLSSASGTRTLKLFPQVEKQPVSGRARGDRHERQERQRDK